MRNTYKVTLHQLLEEELLVLNKQWEQLDLSVVTSYTNQGVYLFKGVDGIPLYIGVTDNIGRRVSSHLNGWGNQDVYSYPRELVSVEYFEEDDVLYRDIYESYLIHIWEPRYNVSKTNKVKLKGDERY